MFLSAWKEDRKTDIWVQPEVPLSYYLFSDIDP